MKRLPVILLFFASSLFVAAQPPAKVYIKKVDRYQPGKENVLVSPGGRQISITVLPKDEQWLGEKKWMNEEASEDGEMMSKASRRNVDPALTAAQKKKIRSNQCRNEKFSGFSRSHVKTSLASGKSITYSSLEQFVKTLPRDSDMVAVIRALQKPYAQRAIQEDKRVRLKNVYLYAYAREEDNDYHLILTNKDQTLFFNAEISGLPHSKAAAYATLKKVRATFEQFPGELRCGNYVLPSSPLLIRQLRGSLFFDTDHPAGQVGPAGSRPATAWEIHPVTFIEFE